MKHFYTPLIKETKEYVADFVADHFSETICYHNIDHTLEVVEAVQIIAEKCQIDDRQLEIVLVAAWFHDTGYYMGCENHEKASAEIAQNYLRKKELNEDFINAVSKCILSTKVPQNPQSLLEKIICDADLFHLATDKFFEKSELLWKEFSYTDQDMTPETWLNQSRQFVESHRYHTEYGKKVLYPNLIKNLERLNSKIDSTSL